MISKKIFSIAATALLICGLSTNAFAELFSVSVGVPVQQTFSSEWGSGDKVEAESVSGAFLHVKFPIMLGVGYESYTTVLKSPISSLKGLELETTMLDVFWLTPIPIINFTIGAGVGTANLSCSQFLVSGTTCDDVFESGGFASATQLYAQLGFNIVPLIDLHLSYQVVSASVKEKGGGDTSTFNSNVIGLGAAIIF